jgi:hypothetical protein
MVVVYYNISYTGRLGMCYPTLNNTSVLSCLSVLLLILGYEICSSLKALMWLKCRTAMKVLFLYLILCLNVKFDRLSYVHLHPNPVLLYCWSRRRISGFCWSIIFWGIKNVRVGSKILGSVGRTETIFFSFLVHVDRCFSIIIIQV